jgi:hypothetical protein
MKVVPLRILSYLQAHLFQDQLFQAYNMSSVSADLAAWRSSVATAAPKTAEQIRAEYAAMNFEQLRARAGPPPTVSGCDYYNNGAGEGNSDGAEKYNFDSSIGLFKQGRGAPPAPLLDNNRPEARAPGVIAYGKWYSLWGNKLTTQWYKEHPRATPIKKTSPPATLPTASTSYSVTPTAPTASTAPKRAEITVVAEKSGW